MTNPSTPPGSDEQLAVAMRDELRTLLDAVPDARRVLPYLAVLEQGLGEMGAGVIERLPPAALEKAGAQLAALPAPRQARALTQLLMLIQLTIEDRAPHRRGGQAAPFLSSFLTENKLELKEGTHSDFMRVLDGPTPPR